MNVQQLLKCFIIWNPLPEFLGIFVFYFPFFDLSKGNERTSTQIQRQCFCLCCTATKGGSTVCCLYENKNTTGIYIF